MIIRREALNAALAATTADDTRYFLNAVQVNPDKHAIIATNGHILLVATDKAPQLNADFPIVPGAAFHGSPVAPVLIPADSCRAIVAAMPKRSSIPILGSAQLSTNGSPSTFTLASTDLAAPRIATIDTTDAGNFPAYERVMPKLDRPSVNVIMAVDVLEQLIKAAKAAQGSDKRTAKITFNVPTGKADLDMPKGSDDTQGRMVSSALGVTITGPDVTVTGAAMPCRL
jgi:DNA polymerase III sliding clamp (beta) subunit (PCNA family)